MSRKNKKHLEEKKIGFELKLAKESLKDFSQGCAIPCTLYSAEGEKLYSEGGGYSKCSFCEVFHELKKQELPCKNLHKYGALEAERIGGRYIYTCPVDLCFTTSPIMINGTMAGFMTAGPIGMPNTDVVLESKVFANRELSIDLPEHLRKINYINDSDNIREHILKVKCASPAVVRSISGQLFNTCLYVSDSMHELYLAKNNAENDGTISDVLIGLNADEEKKGYPSDTEFELFEAISNKNHKKSVELLNVLLGYIFLYYKSKNEIQARITQVLTIISRAAVRAGASGDYVLKACDNYIIDLQKRSDITSILRWSAENTSKFINMIFEMIGDNRSTPIGFALSYIQENCTDNITLEEVAEEAGYSATYFSKIFKEETGENFKSYLIKQRIEKSKIMIMTTKLSLSEICTQSGFSDQSYFCKIFKQLEGVTPNRYKNRPRRIDESKEKTTG